MKFMYKRARGNPRASGGAGIESEFLTENSNREISYLRRKELDHQLTIIDDLLSAEPLAIGVVGMDGDIFEVGEWNNAATQAPLSPFSTDARTYEEVDEYAKGEEEYVLASTEDMSRYEPNQSYDTKTEAEQRIKELVKAGDFETGGYQAMPLWELN